MRRIFLENI
ncbi:Protein of unknown function [Pyronema omphalodes CBS 100304]|uniref:Uncharacterized protein n=1 Tax=Pyronema omphalodes (strain CBS 100304) TaxID=1076935 RepID=U4LQS2_PYROM|nr:Protein of unknown function [Pyronema omphalodes CBS 100304]